ncbi:MAG: LuxR family transcriptional regulator [Dehalococcoidia bacterium]|nr:MAG: LuxR family transcriptional regulator [Dehalococcoidia bacterium]
MGNRGRPKHPDILTPREWEVLALLRENRTNEEIAEALGITYATARFHVAEILGKLGVASRYEAAAWQAERPERRLWVFAPIVALRGVKWNTLAASLGALAIISALSLVAALVWGASRTHIAPAAFGDPATICTPGPTHTTTPKDYRPTPPTWSPEGPGPVITAAIQTRVPWTDAFFAAGCDMHKLPAVSGGIYDLYNHPQTLGDAITKGDWVVMGHVTSAVFKSEPDLSTIASSIVTVAVDEALKGSITTQVTLKQRGGPTTGYGGIVVFTAPGDQLLLQGDDVLLIGSPYGQSSGVYTFFPVGKYMIRDGKVYAVAGNPCNTLDGLAAAEASRIIRDFVRSGVAEPRLNLRCDWSRFEPGYPTPIPTPAG